MAHLENTDMQDKPRHPGGRPLKFKSVEELQKKIDAYFADCDSHVEDVTEWVQARNTKGQLKKDENGLNYLVEVTHKIKTVQRPYTITGLAIALGTNRSTLINYEDKEEYFDTIKNAKEKIHNFTEERLYDAHPAAVIFNLKNNYGWKDKTEVEQENTGELTIKIEKFDGDNSTS